jgi:alkylation response protein AidB-like acyl-CoA dehydrogenase
MMEPSSGDTERAALRSAINGVLGTSPPAERWPRLVELGLLGLGVPVEDGGSGGSPVELGLAVQACAAEPIAIPLLSSLFAVRALLSASAGVDTGLLAEVCSGKTRAALVIADEVGAVAAPGRGVQAVELESGSWQLRGVSGFAMDAADAELLLIAAVGSSGPALFGVANPTPGLQVDQLPSLDATRPLATVTLSDASAQLVAPPRGWDPALVMTEIAALLATDSAGGARAVLDVTVDYAKQRKQFGRAIGSFQAVKHRLAEMSLAVDASLTASDHALRLLGTGDPDTALYASIAKIVTSENYLRVAADSIQTFGGIGFTWEHSAHLHLKRAQANCQLFGSGHSHVLSVAEGIGI